MRQRTLKKEVVFEGVGVHTGERSRVVLKPLPENSGVVFSLGGRKEFSFKVGPSSVVCANRATGLGVGGRCICTAEHLLSALYGLGVDNVLVEVYGSEIPVMDGSAISFCNFILEAGIEEQDAEKIAYRVEKKVSCRLSNRKIIEFSPMGEGLEVEYTIVYDHPLIGKQDFIFRFGFSEYYREIAPSRTFGFLKDYSWLKDKGLAQGASVLNTVVLSCDSYINPYPLRFKDEFVRHKVLDLIGDLSILGGFLLGKVRVICGGHELHHRGIFALVGSVGALSATNLNGVVKSEIPEKPLFYF